MKPVIRTISLILTAVLALGSMSLCAFASPQVKGKVTAVNGYEITVTLTGGGRGPEDGQQKQRPSDAEGETQRKERPAPPADGERKERPEPEEMQEQTAVINLSGVPIVTGGKDAQTAASLSDITVGTMLRLTVENNAVLQAEIVTEQESKPAKQPKNK